VFIPKSTGAKGEYKTNDYACTIKETKPLMQKKGNGDKKDDQILQLQKSPI
jgi:hypothetical protein